MKQSSYNKKILIGSIYNRIHLTWVKKFNIVSSRAGAKTLEASMDLKSWLEGNAITHKEFADRIPISRSYVTHIVTGRSSPPYKLACRIEEVTKGEVPKTNWFPEKVVIYEK